jgi:UDP-N-acetylmuramate--alanine ligase
MNIFLSGIGGVSMSGLAHIALKNGHKVFGSDLEESESVKRLKNEGAVIYGAHSAENIDSSIDLFVYTAAIRKDNPEYLQAKKLGIKMQNRAEFLGDVMKSYENSISVAGTHGKTTTTSMLSTIMMKSNNDPTILVGGNLGTINGNVRVGNSDNFITEACEYTNSFLNFKSNIGIVLNIEADHLDYFKDLDEIINSFNEFGKLIKPEGYFIINGDDKNTKRIGEGVEANVIRFGENKDNDFVINIESYDENGCATFTLRKKHSLVDSEKFKLSVPGRHNVFNATASILAGYFSGVEVEDLVESISLYTGVGRRFEHKGITKLGAKVVDDYAHHPTEIKATLSAVKNMGYNKVYVTFQPHTFTRTETLLDEFSRAFNDADVVVIPDIYASRELFTDRISSRDLVREIIKNKKNESQEVCYIPELEDVASFLEEKAQKGDIILTVGAGDIYKVGEMIVK